MADQKEQNAEENVKKSQIAAANAVINGSAMSVTLLNARISKNNTEITEKLQSVVDLYVHNIQMES